MDLSFEEKLVIEFVKIYSNNSIEESIDLNNLHFNINKLISAVNTAGCAGMVYKMINGNKIKNAPEKLIDFTEAEFKRYQIYCQWSDYAAEKIIRHCNDNNIKLVFAGKYVTAKEYMGYADLLCDEIIVYINRDTEFDLIVNEIKIEKILMNEDFFEKHYNDCIKFNRVDIKLLYETIEEKLDSISFNSYLINLYILYCFMIEHKNNFGLLCKAQFKSQLNIIFGSHNLINA